MEVVVMIAKVPSTAREVLIFIVERFFPVVLFIALYKVVFSSFRLSHSVKEDPKVWSFSCKLLSSTLRLYCFFAVRWERQNARKGLKAARLFAPLPFVKARFKAVFRFACAVAIVDSLSLPNLPNSTEIKVLNDGAK